MLDFLLGFWFDFCLDFCLVDESDGDGRRRSGRQRSVLFDTLNLSLIGEQLWSSDRERQYHVKGIHDEMESDVSWFYASLQNNSLMYWRDASHNILDYFSAKFFDSNVYLNSKVLPTFRLLYYSHLQGKYSNTSKYNGVVVMS